MMKYELALVLSAKIEDEERAAMVEKVQAMITTAGAAITNVDEWGKKQLAYEIQKMKEGYYYFIQFEGETTVPAELEERLRIEAECSASIAAIKEYQLEIELVINNYLRENIEVFSKAFTEMELAYNTGDVDSFIGGTNTIVRQLGGVPLFETQEEFNELMKSNITFEL